MEQLLIIKIGGNVIDDEKSFKHFLMEFAELPQKKILVHGGGKIATELGNKLQIVSNYVDGRRITNDETIDLVTMVYGGLINKKAVALLQSYGCNALGITGADANLVPADKRPATTIDYGWVGDPVIERVPAGLWKTLLEKGIVPVAAPLTHDGAGHILNTNADTIASVLARSLASQYEVSLIYCFEKEGILTDINDENSYLRVLDETLFNQLKRENKLFAGILPKLQNAFEAIHSGVRNVIIGRSDKLKMMIQGEAGTYIS